MNDAIQSGQKTLDEIFEILMGNEDLEQYPVASSVALCKQLRVNSVVVNGLVYENTGDFTAADFSLLSSIALQSGALELQNVLNTEDGARVEKGRPRFWPKTFIFYLLN